MTKGNDDNDDEHAGGGGDVRSRAAWMAELASLLEGAGMGYSRSADPGVFSGYDATRGFLNGDVLCPLPRCMGIPGVRHDASDGRGRSAGTGERRIPLRGRGRREEGVRRLPDVGVLPPEAGGGG